MKYVLASNSPRRKEILAQCNISFDVIPSSYDEALENDDFSYPLIENIALQKAKSTAQKIKFPALIISADTLVVFEGKIFAKPKDKNEAKQMLKSLSDKTHSVVTAHCVLNTTSNKAQIKSDTSYVTFFPLSDETKSCANFTASARFVFIFQFPAM